MPAMLIGAASRTTATCCNDTRPKFTPDGRPPYPKGTRMICNGLTVKSGTQTIYLDDPKARQRYAKDMTPKQREKFAKFYVRKVLKAKEYSLWLNRMLKK